MNNYIFTFKPKLIKRTKGANVAHGKYGAIRKRDNIPYGVFATYNYAGIYAIQNKITHKEYIGASKDIQRRLLKHFNELFHRRHRNKELQKEFNLYGFDNFIIEIYEKTNENLLEKEKQYQINKGIENLYNEKIAGYYMTDEYRKQLASSHKNTHKSKEYREKMSKMKTHRIAKYTLSGEYIFTYNSCNEICEKFGYTKSVILSACNGSKKQAYGYKWRYIDKDGNIITKDARHIK